MLNKLTSIGDHYVDLTRLLADDANSLFVVLHIIRRDLDDNKLVRVRFSQLVQSGGFRRVASSGEDDRIGAGREFSGNGQADAAVGASYYVQQKAGQFVPSNRPAMEGGGGPR